MRSRSSTSRKRRSLNSNWDLNEIYRSEAEFREEEKTLREKDQHIQDSMIKFSTFL